jgi:hypothetical protein
MSQSADGAAGDADSGPVTIYDVQGDEKSKIRVRALPRLTSQALRIAWAAGPKDRSFSLAHFLRTRHRSLYDERIAELRRVASKQLWYALLANVGVAAVLAATLLLVGWLTLSGGVPLSAAGIAVAGVGIVGERLTIAAYSAGTLQNRHDMSMTTWHSSNCYLCYVSPSRTIPHQAPLPTYR